MTDFLQYHYWRYKRDAKNRSIPFSISFPEFKYLVNLPCHYCNLLQDCFTWNNGGRHKIKYYYCNGLDRQDRSIGYHYLNLLPCCKSCNRTKWNKFRDDYKKFKKSQRRKK